MSSIPGEGSGELSEGEDMKVRLTVALDKRGFVCVWRSEGRNTAITVSRSVCERKEKYSPLFQ